MKYHLPAFFRTTFVLLLICLLCLSQISSASIYQPSILRATEFTDENSVTSNLDTTVSDTPSVSDTNDIEHTYTNTETVPPTYITSPSKEKAATNGAIHATPTPSKKTTRKSIKKIFFAQSSIELWPSHSTYNPITIKIQGTSYRAIKWSVSNSSYAKISSDGTVTLKKSGAGKTVVVTATVYYKSNGTIKSKSASYTIYGKQPVQNLKITNTKNFIFLNKRLTLRASCFPNTASCKKILWSGSNDAYATISQKGIVQPKQAGVGKTVTFTATTTDGSMIVKTIKVRIIDPTKPMIALTFDDGPTPAYTTKIINQLEQFDAHATFFVLGSKLTGENSKSVIQKAAKCGNEIASHTYNHKQLTSLSAANIQQEAARTENAIKQLIGTSPSLTRPPYGSINDTVKNNISTPLILWSVDSCDSETNDKTTIVENIINNIKDGDIILMHDISAPSADAAVELIPKLIQKGYQLVTVSELAAYKNKKLKSGYSYSNIE